VKYNNLIFTTEYLEYSNDIQVLSKNALKLFIEKAMATDKDSDQCRAKTQTGVEDVELARCRSRPMLNYSISNSLFIKDVSLKLVSELVIQ